MAKALERLLKVANTLDQLGMYEYADQIDLMVLAGGQRSRAVDDFINELKRIFVIVANAPSVPSINSENLQVILNVIDTVAEKANFTGPDMSIESIRNVEDEVRAAVEGMMELNRSVDQLTAAFQSEQDPEEKRKLGLELDRDNKQLSELRTKIQLWRNGKRKDDSDKYKKFEQLWNEQKGS